MAGTKVKRRGVCAVCGRPSCKIICDSCAQRIQGGAIENWEEIERKGADPKEKLAEIKIVDYNDQ